MKKIFIIVSHSSGELDTLLPLLYELNQKYHIIVKILIPVKKIYKQIINNNFIMDTLKQLNIKLKFSQSYNKFDYRSEIIFLKKIIIQLKYIISNIDILTYKYYFHETTNQKNSTFIFKIASFFSSKKIFIYHHGQSLNQTGIFYKNFNYNKNNIYLAFSSANIDWAKGLGFNKIKVIGFSKFYKNWIYYVKKYSTSIIKNEKYVVIFSRPYDHPYYMNLNKYKYLLKTTHETITKLLPDHEILIKPHPREDVKKIINIIDQLSLKNIKITKEHSTIISSKAKFTISFWSSAIFDSLSLEIPSIEYYIEDEQFKKIEPLGSLYRKNGIVSVNNPERLEENIVSIIKKKYIQPKIINYFKSEMDIDFLN